MQQSITDIAEAEYRIENFPVFEITPIKVDNTRIEKGISTLHFKLKLDKKEARMLA
ncbi:hypothetical protein [Mucilaginibacter panaciglaebae]|uniref:Uncharacterized protein n=1 Tax=Mucilaginibacter panaciglaebae TaxID=502331 RepID=A0ABP7WJG1_9SPHI